MSQNRSAPNATPTSNPTTCAALAIGPSRPVMQSTSHKSIVVIVLGCKIIPCSGSYCPFIQR